MPETAGMAVIGCGQWGANLVRVLRRLGALRAVADPAPEGRARGQEIAPGIKTYATAQEVLEDPRVSAVLIATPAATHAALAAQALEAGKDVFVEKPLALAYEQGRRLVEQARAARRVLMVGHLLEYHPGVLELQKLLRQGSLGEIRYIISNRLNLGRIRTEENALWSFAPHDIAVILRLVGEMPLKVVATGGCYLQAQIADVTVTQLLFANGVRSHVFVSWLHPYKEQKLVVIGSRRMATFDDVQKRLSLMDVEISWEVGAPVPRKSPAVEIPYPPDEPLECECRHFVECVRTGGRPRTDGESALRVLGILNAAQASLSAEGEPVRIDLDGRRAAPDRPPPVPVTTVVSQEMTSRRAPVRSQ